MSLFQSQGTNVRHAYSKAFEQAYQAYPRHVAKGAAAKAWDKAIKREDASVILAAVVAYAASPAGRSGRFIPHFATWLNADRWTDDRSEWLRVPVADRKTEAVEAKVKADVTRDLYRVWEGLPEPERSAVLAEAEAKFANTTIGRRDRIAYVMKKRGGA